MFQFNDQVRAHLAVATVVSGYDRILCDVMCSGDGTLRKASHLLRGWQARDGQDACSCTVALVKLNSVKF
eukprot:3457936-Amphidinium_carterae.1